MNIFITGAASGIGQALAFRISRPGITLHLCDINTEALKLTAQESRTRGARVTCHPIDVRNRESMEDWLMDQNIPRMDMLFACAGITGGRPPADLDGISIEREERVREMFDINLNGALNTLLPAIRRMRTQSPDSRGMRGRITVMASVAGFVAYPGTPSYSASKSALDRFAVSAAPALAQAGISLTSVCCGFVDSPMVARNRFPMPGLVSPTDAAQRILRGTLRGDRRVIFPRWLVFGSRLVDLLPPRLMELYYCRQPSAQPAGMPDF